MQPGMTSPPVNKKSRYWKISGVLFLVFILMMIADISDDPDFECGSGDFVSNTDVNDGFDDCRDGSDEYTPEAIQFEQENADDFGAAGTIGSLSCCGSFIFMILALSARNQQIMFVQRGFPQAVVQPVIQQQIIHRPTPAPQPPAPTPQQMAPAPQTRPKGSSPQDLEKARDFEAAADEYQRLGMYAEAGRVRAMHLEKDQPLVSIGSVGDTILNDSVMVSHDDSAQRNCPSCGKEVAADFNLCPYCQHNL
jgi:hypothetical protein